MTEINVFSNYKSICMNHFCSTMSIDEKTFGQISSSTFHIKDDRRNLLLRDSCGYIIEVDYYSITPYFFCQSS